MKVEFAENVSNDIIELMSSIPALFKSIKPADLNRFEELTIRTTDSKQFACEIVFDSCICISQKTIEIIWSLNYAHIYFYDTFCKGLQPEGKFLDLNSEEWDKIKPQLTWAVNSLKGDDLEFQKSFSRDFFCDNKYGVIFNYTLLYFISHELFHMVHKLHKLEIIDEERQCDYSATNFIINALSDDEYLERSKGLALGLMVLNVYGIHSSYYDGITHPFTYDRLIENLLLVFGAENDKIWGFVLGLIALHSTEANIGKPEEDYANFFDAVNGYIKLFQQQQQNLK